MKKSWMFLLVLALAVLLCYGCTRNTEEEITTENLAQLENTGLTMHRIGVATYNVADPQVRAFKSYLDSYIMECFPDVTFLYSESISSSEEMMVFLEECVERDVEGVMFFNSFDLVREVEYCAENGVYAIRPSATSTDEVFEALADNPYFVGEIGPGTDREYAAAADMTQALAADGKQYILLSGGAYRNNEMHRLRTVAMLDVLQESCGVSFDKSSEELALSDAVVTATAGSLTVCICPGYLDDSQRLAEVEEVMRSGAYTTVLSTIPVTQLMDLLKEMHMESGVLDFFSDENYYGFKNGTIAYVAGKYQSEIGPGFAALYNAITGNGEAFRVDGRAFRLEQGFWTAADSTEYDTKYALACSATINAYNYEDLYSVTVAQNPDVSFEDFKALTESYSYEDCLRRRSN